MNTKFRKKPVVIDAMEFTATPINIMALSGFMPSPLNIDYAKRDEPVVKITTLEGVMTAQVGDWIIKGVKGEFYPCKPDIFEATYEPAE